MQWRRDLWLVVLAIGAGAFAAGERILAASDQPGLVTPVLVVGLATAPAAFYAACLGRQLRFTLPTWVVVASAAVAALLGAGMAGLLAYPVLDELGPVSTVAVALVKESVTLLVPLAVLFALPTRRAADGLLVGAAAGVGFAVAETVGYLVTSPDVVGPTAHAVLVRGLLSPAAHLAWAGIVAAALWLAALEHWSGRALRRLVLAMSGVVVLRALWESADSVPVRVLLTALSALLLGWVMVRIIGPRRGVPTRVLARPGAATDGAAESPARPAAAAGAHPAAPVGARPAAPAGARPVAAGVGARPAGATGGASSAGAADPAPIPPSSAAAPAPSATPTPAAPDPAAPDPAAPSSSAAREATVDPSAAATTASGSGTSKA
ncbi:PrsW family glutamic-type intramembrane protease [Cryptosporangium minutisporangium]|uniref:PrsW family intramembrane metalloprotease n=1 Tax=Cryptosporangium minutisporangium TaxID=113569 RepID=A0ABP6SWY0_9ACTN